MSAAIVGRVFPSAPLTLSSATIRPVMMALPGMANADSSEPAEAETVSSSRAVRLVRRMRPIAARLPFTERFADVVPTRVVSTLRTVLSADETAIPAEAEATAATEHTDGHLTANQNALSIIASFLMSIGISDDEQQIIGMAQHLLGLILEGKTNELVAIFTKMFSNALTEESAQALAGDLVNTIATGSPAEHAVPFIVERYKVYLDQAKAANAVSLRMDGEGLTVHDTKEIKPENNGKDYLTVYSDESGNKIVAQLINGKGTRNGVTLRFYFYGPDSSPDRVSEMFSNGEIVVTHVGGQVIGFDTDVAEDGLPGINPRVISTVIRFSRTTPLEEDGDYTSVKIRVGNDVYPLLVNVKNGKYGFMQRED